MAANNKQASRKNSIVSHAGDADWFQRTSMGMSDLGLHFDLFQASDHGVGTKNSEWVDFLMSNEPNLKVGHEDTAVLKNRTRDLREFSLDQPPAIEAGPSGLERKEIESGSNDSHEHLGDIFKRNLSRNLSGFLNLSENASMLAQPLSRAVSQADFGKFVQIMTEFNLNKEPRSKLENPGLSQTFNAVAASPIKQTSPDFSKVALLSTENRGAALFNRLEEIPSCPRRRLIGTR